jgi:hypothetical protein
MKPKEGTMLTVARVIGERAKAIDGETDCVVFLKRLIETGEDILAKTTDMLPALKQTGVVDAGGQGILCIFKGMYAALKGEAETDVYAVTADLPDMRKIDYSALQQLNAADITFLYCTEFIINTFKVLDEKSETELKTFLDGIGDSVAVVCDETTVKLHVHTNNPGSVIERALKLGELVDIDINNMKYQHEEMMWNSGGNKLTKEVGHVVVASGDGFSEIFKSLGADAVVLGGQSMNPSAEDILQAVRQVSARNVFVFPNNKNIILTAEQAAGMHKNCNIVVIPTRSMPQGVTALITYSDISNIPDNKTEMEEAMACVHSGQITRAVRSTVLDNKDIDEGDVLCIFNGDITFVEKGGETDALYKLVKYMAGEVGGEVITLYYGEDASEEEAEAVVETLRADEFYANYEIELQHGGQTVYSYIVSVE